MHIINPIVVTFVSYVNITESTYLPIKSSFCYYHTTTNAAQYVGLRIIRGNPNTKAAASSSSSFNYFRDPLKCHPCQYDFQSKSISTLNSTAPTTTTATHFFNSHAALSLSSSCPSSSLPLYTIKYYANNAKYAV